ncbi:MAG: DUF177 domain-containing protein [Acidimicrobiaceae bacterium]|nr:DUF177 domain-containing protein [Acidimicrobiaceae bacterium]MCY4294256.1 DUF177 domain-containing protein [Acidimicrobiaceae bacterium]
MPGSDPVGGDPPSSRLIVDCARLEAGAVDCIEVSRRCLLADSGVPGARVLDGLVEVEATLRKAAAAYLAVGRVRGTWAAECRRCLEEVRGPLEAPFEEVFEWSPLEGETWPIRDQRIDLAPASHQAAVLSLPLAPLCSPGCAGPDPERFPTGPAAELPPKADAADV